MRLHDPTECLKCGAEDVPVYELGLPFVMPPSHCMGALHLAAHNCPAGGDHAKLQGAVDLRGYE